MTEQIAKTEQAAQVREKSRSPYLAVFVFLSVFTAIEVGVSYLPERVKIPLLVLLSFIKASLVILYFMHLRHDSRLYAMFFVLGLVLIVPLLLIMTVVMPALISP
jgi:cytochrome c oxidase subunit 4